MKKTFTLSLFSLLTITLFAQNVYLSERLEKAMNERPDGTFHISILLKDRVDILNMDTQYRSKNTSQSIRSQQINAALKTKAKETQGAILDLLENEEGVSEIHPLWIVNVIYAKVPYSVIEQLGSRKDIAQLDLNGKLELEAYEESCVTTPPVPNGREIGLERINAHKMWARGYTGRGTIGMSADQGVDPNHPAFPNYVGLYNGDEQGFFALNQSDEFPTFCGDHGTHTLGTVLGLDRLNNDTIGVAFNAAWLGARTICSDDENENENIASWQWAIDPDGDPSTVSDMPAAINNSWWDPQARNECNSIYVDALQATEAVGIAVIFSAGNAGEDGESSITAPKNINYDELNVFCVGNLNGNRNDLPLRSSSSRGPSICGGDTSILIKPEVCAPGTSVRSATFEGGYSLKTGTSMAAPHVAGAVLLLKEAFPDLLGRDFKEALYLTARDLGVPGEDNDYGMGIIDVDAAFEYLVDKGNTPADPNLQVDPVLVNIEVPQFFCGTAATFYATIENQGSDVLETLEILVDFPDLGLQEVLNWSGSLARGERISFNSDPIEIPAGTWKMIVTLQNPNGIPDQYLYNNRMVSTVGTLGRAPLEAYIADHVEGEVCQNTQALLRNEFKDSRADKITYQWYGQLLEGSVLGTGQAFLTPPLTNDRTYYADILAEYSIGMPNNELGSTRVSPAAIGGLKFDAHIPFKLNSVKVYTESRGFCEVELEDSEGNILETKESFLNEVGENTMQLNFDIPRGTGYKLNLIKHRLVISTSGANFPYKIENIATITENSIGAGGDSYYYYFYDWKISNQEVCGRIPVSIEVDAQMGAPVSSFTSSAPSVDINNDPTVEFEDASTNAESWAWNFGDGTLSTEQNPSHTYTETGDYYVSLTVTNANGCTASSIEMIQVLDASSSINEPIELTGIKVFPNPAHQSINIETNFDAPEDLNVQLTDLLGRPIQQLKQNSVLKGSFQLNISSLTPGIYLLVFNAKDGRAVKKIMKI